VGNDLIGHSVSQVDSTPYFTVTKGRNSANLEKNMGVDRCPIIGTTDEKVHGGAFTELNRYKFTTIGGGR